MDKTEFEIDIPTNLLFELMKEAHEKDITLNKLIENIMTDFFEKQEEKKQ